MGHNSGLKHAGAQGQRKPRDAEIVLEDAAPASEAPLGADEVMDALEKRELSVVRQLARQHTESAVKTLAEIMRARKATHSARVSAAKALLEYGHGKPGSQYTPPAGSSGGDSLKVVIFKLGEGTKEEVRVEKDVTPQGNEVKVEGVEVLKLAE